MAELQRVVVVEDTPLPTKLVPTLRESIEVMMIDPG